MAATELMQQGFETFKSELPDLIKSDLGKWVGYHGTKRLGCFATPDPFYRMAERDGISERDLLVTYVDPASASDDVYCDLSDHRGRLDLDFVE